MAISRSAPLTGGGKIFGDLTIEGDLTVNGDNVGDYNEIVQGSLEVSETLRLNPTISSGSATTLAFMRSGANKWRFIQPSDDSYLKLYNDQASATQMYFKADGKIGVGTDSPTRQLTLAGAGSAILIDSSDHAYIELDRGGADDLAQLKFMTAGSAKWYAGMADSGSTGFDGTEFFIGEGSGASSDAHLVIDASGNIGIGTASPSTLIQIGSNDVANTGLRITNQGVVDAKSIIGFGGSNTQPISAIGGVVESATGNTAGGIYFSTRTSTNNDAPIERMRIDSSGNVGIGTASPSNYNNFAHNLVVYEAGHSGITIATNGTNHTSLYFADGTSGAEAYAGYLDYDHADNSLDIATNGTQAIRIDSSQNATFAGDVTGASGLSINWLNSNTRITGSNSSGFLQFDVGGTSQVLKLDANSRISLSNTDSGGTGGQNSLSGNTILGYKAGNAISSGDVNNVLIGHNAGLVIDAGEANSIIGTNAGDALTSGDLNTALGYFALSTSTDVDKVVAIGAGAMESGNATSGADGTVAIGSNALLSLTSGGRNLAIGFQALDALTEAFDNIAIGTDALGASSATQAHRNIAIGTEALKSLNANGQENIAIGKEALKTANHNDVDGNIAIGNFVLDAVGTAGVWACVGIGYNALTAVNNAGAVGSTAIGYTSLSALTSGAKNTAVGFESGKSTSDGSNNTYVGYEAGQGASGTENNNTGLGKQSLFAVTTAESNVAVGTNTLDELTTGGYNTAIGANALHALDGGETENVAVGYNAGSNADGATNNICIGSNALLSTGTGTNQIVIGKDTTGLADDSVTLGNANVTAVYMAQDKRAKMHAGQIDVTMDSSTNGVIAFLRSENNSDYSSSILTVQGDRTTTNNSYNLANFTNAGTPKCVITDGGDLKNTNNSYGAISDEKLKQDIEDANSQWDDIKAVRFRKFKFKDMVEDGFKLGVVAQELEKVSPSLISEAIDRDADGKDLGTTTKSVKYSILQMKGIVALQEALNRIETLEAKVKELESK